ncbi:hypothetical protein SMD44_01001 [Streptomyces alboflavus]|uniref:Uncharacterized protein n=1 Tax=Streptomyces alboflavus TaxID=67267 RepID=A0A1Z1W583_9ACTN|nr:hypothetical protein [Streptomyces alboflavus]ARX81603.1 hypothetical protein SMD44_01001 [Streptomyces alboflavus]
MSDYPEIASPRDTDMDPFWVEQRAQFLVAMSTSADPSACGTCRSNAKAGQPVKHAECAQRATLLPAPDHPDYEILAGFSLEENEQLPARFHVPVFDDCGVPNSWLCAVCWEEGVVVGWPCATAIKYGTQVFTPLHQAETAQQKQAAELAAYRALELGDPDGRVSASCSNPEHPTWLRAPDDDRGCPWCRVAELDNALAAAGRSLSSFIFDSDDPGADALGAQWLYHQAMPHADDPFAQPRAFRSSVFSEAAKAVEEMDVPASDEDGERPQAYRDGYLAALDDASEALEKRADQAAEGSEVTK